jgi:moderate conductance mechanosensitive channel
MLSSLVNNLSTISGNKLFNILAIILIALLLQRLSGFITRNLFGFAFKSSLFPGSNTDIQRRFKTLNGVFGAIFSGFIWFIALLSIMQILGIPLAPLLTSAGLIGAALAFGTQSLIRDFISGLFIIFENQYRIDDYIQLDKVSGRVKAIGIRTTVIRDEENKLHFIPNGTITSTANLSMGNLHAREKFDVSTDQDLGALNKELENIAKKLQENHSAIIKEGPTFLGIENVSAKSMTVLVQFKTSAPKRQQATSLILEAIHASKIVLS